MVQGRIGFSRSLHTRVYKHGQYGACDGLDQTSGEYARDSGRTEAIALKRITDVADKWIMDSVERRRSRLVQISALQREQILEFIDLLFDENSNRCQEMVDVALSETGDPQKVVEILLEPAARIIGENWCADQCDFLKATIAVLRMQRLFRRMAAEFPPPVLPAMSRRALLTPAPGEQHTFGLSVVDDAFRRAGWEVDCCGCDEEHATFRLVSSNDYHIIGISVSVERRLSDLAAMNRKLRSRSRNKSIVLIAGGSMVMQNPRGAIDAGFDLLAVDAVSAVALADTAVSSLLARVDQRVPAE